MKKPRLRGAGSRGGYLLSAGFLRGRPPFFPFSRDAAALRSVFTLPISLIACLISSFLSMEIPFYFVK